MSIRPLYGMTKEMIAEMIAHSETSMKEIEDERRTRKTFEDAAARLDTIDDPRAREMSDAIRQLAHNDDEIINAHELAQLAKGEAACLLEHLLLTSGYRRDVYTRMLALCAYEALKTLRKALGKSFQDVVRDSLGEEAFRKAREMHSDVTQLFNRAKKSFGEIRDGVAAHRESERGRRQDLLGKFIDWDLPQVSLATIDTLRPLDGIYHRHMEARTPQTLELLTKIKTLGEKLEAEGLLGKKPTSERRDPGDPPP